MTDRPSRALANEGMISVPLIPAVSGIGGAAKTKSGDFSQKTINSNQAFLIIFTTLAVLLAIYMVSESPAYISYKATYREANAMNCSRIRSPHRGSFPDHQSFAPPYSSIRPIGILGAAFGSALDPRHLFGNTRWTR
jgi:hypothetical protein